MGVLQLPSLEEWNNDVKNALAQDIIRMLNYYNISATIINATYSCSVEKYIVSAINLEMISDHFVVFKMYAKLLGVIGKWWKI